jgi:hypothetical protein
MNTCYTLLIVIVQFVCLSSCSITVQYPSKPAVTVPTASGVADSDPPIYNQQTEDDLKQLDTSVTSIAERLSKLEQQGDLLNKTIARVTLCSAFTLPTIPEAPRVDLSKLKSIPNNDHAAVENLLIDNIQAMSDHIKKIESSLKVAANNHRRTCSVREVINKK